MWWSPYWLSDLQHQLSVSSISFQSDVHTFINAFYPNTSISQQGGLPEPDGRKQHCCSRVEVPVTGACAVSARRDNLFHKLRCRSLSFCDTVKFSTDIITYYRQFLFLWLPSYSRMTACTMLWMNTKTYEISEFPSSMLIFCRGWV